MKVTPEEPTTGRWSGLFSQNDEDAGEPDNPGVITDAWPIAILGVPFDHVTLAGAVARIEAMVAARRPHYIVTANVDFLVQARRDAELRRIFLEADLVVCDGTPVLWAARWLGNPLPERVAGSDLAPVLLHAAAERGFRIFFLGAGPGVAAEAAQRMKARFPSLNIVGHYAPPFAGLLKMDHDEIVRRVREAQPDLLFVSFGCPKQEKWIAMHYRSLGVPVVMGVGATIDFLAGRVKRAPAWMQRSGTEWIYRLLQEPRRLYRRYAKDLLHFVPALAAQWCRLRVARSGADDRGSVTFITSNWQGVQAPRRLTADVLRRDARLWRRAMTERRHTLLDLAAVKRVDSTGLAALVHWQKRLRPAGRWLVLLAPSAAVRKALKMMRLDDHFLTAADLAEARHLITARLAEKEASVVVNGAARPLAWRGEVTAANADLVWRLTEQTLTLLASTQKKLVVDLSNLRFIDSAGLSLMLRTKELAERLAADVLFAGASPGVRNTVRQAGLPLWLIEDAA